MHCYKCMELVKKGKLPKDYDTKIPLTEFKGTTRTKGKPYKSLLFYAKHHKGLVNDELTWKDPLCPDCALEFPKEWTLRISCFPEIFSCRQCGEVFTDNMTASRCLCGI